MQRLLKALHTVAPTKFQNFYSDSLIHSPDTCICNIHRFHILPSNVALTPDSQLRRWTNCLKMRIGYVRTGVGFHKKVGVDSSHAWNRNLASRCYCHSCCNYYCLGSLLNRQKLRSRVFLKSFRTNSGQIQRILGSQAVIKANTDLTL